jgi:hypothetical protein
MVSRGCIWNSLAVNGRYELRNPMTRPKSKFYFPRATLVIEIQRRCGIEGCGKRNHISLTRTQAIEYRGFNCTECESWNDDRLSGSEIPDSWNEADGIR